MLQSNRILLLKKTHYTAVFQYAVYQRSTFIYADRFVHKQIKNINYVTHDIFENFMSMHNLHQYMRTTIKIIDPITIGR